MDAWFQVACILWVDVSPEEKKHIFVRKLFHILEKALKHPLSLAWVSDQDIFSIYLSETII